MTEEQLDEQSLIESHSHSLSEYEQQEDQEYNDRMVVVMNEIDEWLDNAQQED